MLGRDWTQFPPIITKRRNAISGAVTTVFAGKLNFPLNAFQYINPDTKDEPTDKMVIFVLEARDSTVVCGVWPCFGWYNDYWSGLFTVYYMDPNVLNVNDFRFRKDGLDGEQMKHSDEEFWRLCPRATFHEKWPQLKQAIDRRHKEIIEEQTRTRKAEDRERYKKNQAKKKADAQKAEETKKQLAMSNFLNPTETAEE